MKSFDIDDYMKEAKRKVSHETKARNIHKYKSFLIQLQNFITNILLKARKSGGGKTVKLS